MKTMIWCFRLLWGIKTLKHQTLFIFRKPWNPVFRSRFRLTNPVSDFGLTSPQSNWTNWETQALRTVSSICLGLNFGAIRHMFGFLLCSTVGEKNYKCWRLATRPRSSQTDSKALQSLNSIFCCWLSHGSSSNIISFMFSCFRNCGIPNCQMLSNDYIYHTIEFWKCWLLR